MTGIAPSLAGGDGARPGKHTTGKGCLRIKRLADVDTGALRQFVARAVAATRRG